ncbi:hypothetical protein PRIPAC_97558 [Pristionchus pacificus]|uniref:Uncharacterized protein n=1 Tax=Pristionchus pacificus TaxID=54126 RepID=A0A2A6BCR7_PRIPA|nr:hypothetical protein PRIPAC_97558 [Pristionchus pacificus]|eukprot:PDM63646.1 hypothetical protein PRIPAC_49619 [Pristionchus pacificus]
MVDLAALKEQLQEIINNLDEMKATEEDRTKLAEAVTNLKRKVKKVRESQELRVTLPTQSIVDALFRSVADKEEKQEKIQYPECFDYLMQGSEEAGWKAAEAKIRAHIKAKTEEVRKIWLEDSDEELEDKENKKNVKNKKA